VISLILILATVSIFISVSYFVYQADRDTWLARQHDAADTAARAVEGFLQNVQDYMAVAGLLNADYLTSHPKDMAALLNQNEALLELLRLDAEGDIITTVHKGEASVLTNLFTLAQSSWFQAARRGETYTGKLQISADDEPYLVMAVPASGNGVLAARLSMRVLWDVVANISFGETGHVYVVDTQGNVIAYQNPEVVLSRTNLNDHAEIRAALDHAGRAWHGSYTSFDGEPVLGFAKAIPNSDWWIFTEVQRREVFAKLRHAILTLGGALIALTLLTNSVVRYMLRRLILDPLERLRAGVERVGQGEMDYRLEHEHADELGQVAATFNEMTARLQQREQALAQARDEALAASRFKSRLLANVSHDLRTPLNGILGYTDMLKEGVLGSLEARQEATVDRILYNTERLLSMINSLLDQARIEANELKLRYAPFDPADLLNDVEKVMGSLAEGKGLAFHTAIDNVPNPIVGDRQRLHQIVMNLVDNALKFTDEGEINVRFSAAGQAWTIEVQDTGRGIPEDEQSRLFAPFYQVDNSTTREQGGVGLGLAIVRQLATAMGGDVLLASEVGKGSIFMVMLPINPSDYDPTDTALKEEMQL
jgi:signal transduction histidine kinase